MTGFVIGLIVGGTAGAILICLLVGGSRIDDLTIFWDMVNLLKRIYYRGSEVISLQGTTNEYKYEQATSSLLQTLWNIRRFFNNALEIDIDRECDANVLP